VCGKKLENYFPEHECVTVPDAGFAGKKNGELLASAEIAGFEIFLRLDRGIGFEQNLANRKLAIIIVRSRSSRLVDLLSYVPEGQSSLRTIQCGQLIRLGGSTRKA
jgi:hypothetical protein